MAKMVRGTIESCACPHCKKPNDFRDDIEFIEDGNSFFCDHCKGKIIIVQVRKVTLLLVRAA